MQQQTVFPVLSVQSNDQAKLAKDLAVITNVLNMRVIEIEQRNPNIRQLEGIMVCRYREVQVSDESLMAPTDSGHTEAQRYPHEISGGSLVFLQNPYARRALGTGRVAFLIDDNEPVPRGAKSGAKTGWNREFLASHMNDPQAKDYWVIVDDDIRREIADRANAIKVNVAKEEAEERERKDRERRGEVVIRPLATGVEAAAPAPDILPQTQQEALGGQGLEGGAHGGVGSFNGPVAQPAAPSAELAALAEKLSTALSRIESMEAENASLRSELEKRTKGANANHFGRPRKGAMAVGFAGAGKKG